MKFYKVHALGSDYVLFDGRDADDVDWNALTRRICDRHTGVGADGTLILLNSAVADVRMRAVNADGSEAGTLGVGILAFARYCFENGVVRGLTFFVETGVGIVKPRILLKSGRIDGVRVDMGEPLFDAADVPVAVDGRAIDMLLTEEDRTFSFTALRMGEPHAVVFVDSLDEADVNKYGPMIENDPMFPQKTNVDFVEVVSSERIRMRTRKRGSGPVLACGNGACAAAVACAQSGKTGRNVAVEAALGTMQIEWSETDGHVFLTGPAETVFSGVWNR